MKYPAYPQYKDSGVAWLGDVPEGWDVKKIRYLAHMKGGSTPSTTENQFWDDGDIPWVSPKDMKVGRIMDTQDHLTPEGAKQCASGTLAPGHVLIVVRSGILRHSLPVAINDVPVTLNQDMRAFKLGVRLDAEYLRWFIEGNQKLLLEQWCKSGTTVESIEMSYLANGLMPVPPKTEQTAIADFLDSETGRIDTLVAKKRKLVELLKEKRSALISRTVTRGLPADAAREFGLTTGNASVHEAPANYGRGDFNRPQAEANKFAPTNDPAPSQAFKDSGVEWLGEIPTHWDLKKFGHISIIVRGASPRPAGDPRYFDGDFIPWITVGEITKDDRMFLTSTEAMLTEEGAGYSRIINSGTLVLTNSGATLGVPKILNISGCGNDGIVAFESVSNIANIKFLYFYLKSLTNTLRDRIKQGSGQPNLNTEIISSLSVPIPPITEQTAIAAYLDRETAKIDRLVEKVETAITRLQEYRSALITAAVTGKIDVREA
ncbi:restriction endonuclease subunit S [Methylomonas sp. MgM2]